MEKQTTTRERLALWVVSGGLAAVVLLGVTAVVFAGVQKDTASAAQLILTTTLPVIGTWVGTVLAFYFAKENYESAATQTRALLSGTLERPAREIAIPRSAIELITLPKSAGPETLTLALIRLRLDEIKRFRVPIFDEDGRARYVVHRQPLDTFIADSGGAADQLTLLDLLNSGAGAQVQNSFAVIAESSTVADAKTAMEARPNCQDVFLSGTGRIEEPVSHWITNNEIQRASKA